MEPVETGIIAVHVEQSHFTSREKNGEIHGLRRIAKHRSRDLLCDAS